MPTVIMPKMGDGMEEGTLLRWLKDEGEEIAEGDPIAEIETDKVTIEIMAEDSGTLSQRIAGEGDSVPVGEPIAMILAEGETAEAVSRPQPAAVQATEAESPPVPAATASIDSATPEAAPPRQEAPARAAESTPTNGQTPVERAPGERLRASPLVKRLAVEHEIDLQHIPGSGPGGRIVKDDIMPYISGEKAKPAAGTAPPTAPAPEEAPAAQPAVAPGRPRGTVHELSRIRRTTGRRMAESKRDIPHFYVTAEIDMGAAVAFREQVNSQTEDDASKISFNDLIVKAAALALREFPALNASFEGDQLYDHANIDINIAIALDGGLIAPFIPDADQKSLGTIARMGKDLISRAKNGGLKPEEYQGGTFTTSNLGMLSVDQFIAVINPPQAAILAIGSIKNLPVINDGKIVPGHRMNLAVSADHRAVDGAEVARFLQAVRRYLERPMLLALG
ncbi:MAG TPA: dihydrolipoamide acetyltransferase family protein [Thermomicrobiales bacterium]|nr:dihydrolipoamide acetyltransferase family protein [Thermomicrobiales bacterium]